MLNQWKPSRLAWILLGGAALIVGCDSSSKLRSAETFNASNGGSVVVETWRENAPMEQSVWRICLRPKDSTNLQTLFTVEAVFQASEPGYPRLVETNGSQVLKDTAESYIFSLTSRDFITNRFPGDVYLGEPKVRTQ
jgi:hypothetical protein